MAARTVSSHRPQQRPPNSGSGAAPDTRVENAMSHSTPFPQPVVISRRIPGGRFIAALLLSAFAFGGAAAFADAGRIEQVSLVTAPAQDPSGAIEIPTP